MRLTGKSTWGWAHGKGAVAAPLPVNRSSAARTRAPLFLSLISSLAACGTLRSGTALLTELHIPGVNRLLVADALTRAMLNRGYHIRNLDDRQAVFAKPADPVPGAMLLGAGRENTPESRVRYALSEADGGVRIVARIEVVTNPGSRMEHISPPNGGNAAELVQQALSTVRERLTRKASPRVAAPPLPRPRPSNEPAATPSQNRPQAASGSPQPEKQSWERPAEDMLDEMERRAMGNK